MLPVDAIEAVLEPGFAWFTRRETAYAACALIFAALLVLWPWFRSWVVARPVREIGRVVSELKQIPDHRSFVHRYPDIGQQLRGSRWLAHTWKEFDESLLKPEDIGPQAIRNTARPGDYLNRESCGLNFPIWHALPNYFVGVGLLFTFIGLVAGLHFASDAVGGSVEQATRGLRNLLNAATLKFLASIAGLSCSIVFSVVYHRGIKALDRAFEDLNGELERLMEFALPEAIADQQLRQLEQQTTELRKFNTNIAMEIVKGLGDRLDASIAEGLKQAIEPLGAAVDRLSSRMAGDNLDAVRELAETFRQQLQAGAGQEFAQVAEGLGQLRTLVRDAGAQMNEAAGRLAEVSESMQGQITEGARAAGVALENSLSAAGGEMSARLEQAAASMEATFRPLGERLGSFEASLRELDDKLHGQAEAFGRISRQAEQAAEAVGAAAGEMRNAGQPLVEAGRQLDGAVARMSETGAALQATREGLGDLAQRLSAVSTTLERSWQAYAQRFDQVDERLEAVFTGFADGTRAYQETVKEFVTELDSSLDKSVRTLSSGVGQLEDVVGELSDAVNRMGWPPQAAE